MGDSGRQQTGERGEALAEQALVEAGLRIRERNWRCPAGEIDIVAEETAPDYARGVEDATWLVLVEVRTRRGSAFGTARQSFPPKKQAKLREVAQHYLQSTGWDGPWRIDAVAVQLTPGGQVERIDHIRHAIGG